eukprot:CAMPEP_0197660464 /NCGR_PEP_ID=MMETSP1338-20131121/50860_1 /TAXON_ID=43686 ORGANISM="Pelagodinium beii, Strain RCC1491" /NCGR_SAMPLE_ID=MMETSP1338 /ASSEMBLY_ACC=CAM_ASM_000754 /LENGTH=340 /DNA_ID=CAMNT_0043237815 /DNA_START=42 /DNA_END=1061 /DNA_ORIENTATION=+
MANDKKKTAANGAKGNTKVKDAEMDAQEQQVLAIIEASVEKLPEKAQPYLKSAAPYLAKAWVYFLLALPYIVEAILQAQKFIAKLPEKILWATIGFLVCFFGGIFPATIAAAEAWNSCGGVEAWHQAGVLWEECMKISDAQKKDDDSAQNGAVNTKETPQQLIQRKFLIAMAATEPERINAALTCLYTGWIGVIGVLKLEFAKTVTLGDVIGSTLYQRVAHYEPAIASMVPEEYRKWVPTGTRWACKAVAISVAWFIQRVISAFHSAIRGGMMFSSYLVDFLHEQGYLKEESKNTNIDEVIGWSVAALGFLTQLACGFHLPLLLSLVLWPLQILEAFIVW